LLPAISPTLAIPTPAAQLTGKSLRRPCGIRRY